MEIMTPKIILASGSPRRKELLEQIGVRFAVVTANVDETPPEGLSHREVVEVLAQRKCEAVASEHPDAFVIAADTIVVFKDEILGKPKTSERAIEMLQKLNDSTHQVITGVAYQLLDREIKASFSVSTEVTFHKLTDELIERYVASGEPLDKAGGYGIQGLGAALVKRVEGSYWNVVGLPLSEVVEVLVRELGDGVVVIQTSRLS